MPTKEAEQAGVRGGSKKKGSAVWHEGRRKQKEKKDKLYDRSAHPNSSPSRKRSWFEDSPGRILPCKQVLSERDTEKKDESMWGRKARVVRVPGQA